MHLHNAYALCNDMLSCHNNILFKTFLPLYKKNSSPTLGAFENAFEMRIEGPMHISNMNWCLINFFQIAFGLDATLQMLKH